MASVRIIVTNAKGSSVRKMKIFLDKDAYMPVRAHSTDAGLDLKARDDFVISAYGSAIIDTGVHVELPKGTCGLLVSKSGLNIKHNITSTGLIDEGYTGPIVVKLYNNGYTDYKGHAGDKVSQLVIMPVLYEQLELVDSFKETERGASGFGSTGK